MQVDNPPMEAAPRLLRHGVYNLNAKKTPLINDYVISTTVLGLGINGKVVECFNRTSQQKFALKVSFICSIVILVTWLLNTI